MTTAAGGRLLAVHAHPDDESSKGGATWPHYLSQGAQVLIVSCTGGERGDVLNERLVETDPGAVALAERDMGGLRRVEMARAQEIVGYDHRWLGFADSGLPDEGEPLPSNCFALIPLEHSAEPLVRIIREFRPHVMITYDENGGYPHPDHIRNHEVSMYALDAAADPARYPDAGEPWQIQKVYYDRIFNAPRASAVLEFLRRADPHDPRIIDLEGFVERASARPDRATTHVKCGEHFDTRDAALLQHASQVSPDSSFFFWPNDVQREAWPFEDFELVINHTGDLGPESDLFHGIDLTGSTT